MSDAICSAGRCSYKANRKVHVEKLQAELDRGRAMLRKETLKLETKVEKQQAENAKLRERIEKKRNTPAKPDVIETTPSPEMMAARKVPNAAD